MLDAQLVYVSDADVADGSSAPLFASAVDDRPLLDAYSVAVTPVERDRG